MRSAARAGQRKGGWVARVREVNLMMISITSHSHMVFVRRSNHLNRGIAANKLNTHLSMGFHHALCCSPACFSNAHAVILSMASRDSLKELD
jgi:hypothetical protein